MAEGLGLTALPRVSKHHLVKRKKGKDFANKKFNTFSYHGKGTVEIETKKGETKKRHKEKKKLIFGIY